MTSAKVGMIVANSYIHQIAAALLAAVVFKTEIYRTNSNHTSPDKIPSWTFVKCTAILSKSLLSATPP